MSCWNGPTEKNKYYYYYCKDGREEFPKKAAWLPNMLWCKNPLGFQRVLLCSTRLAGTQVGLRDVVVLVSAAAVVGWPGRALSQQPVVWEGKGLRQLILTTIGLKVCDSIWFRHPQLRDTDLGMNLKTIILLAAISLSGTNVPEQAFIVERCWSRHEPKDNHSTCCHFIVRNQCSRAGIHCWEMLI